jgi:hypothetical protein
VALAKRVKVKVGEKLTNDNIERVIKLLAQPKPITKKEACEVLNISYNTTRLAAIIENYQTRQEADSRRRAANRGKPASPDEIKSVINEYLNGSTVSDIADGLYRSTTFVRNIIETVGVPQRGVGEDYFNFSPLPEQCISEAFNINEVAWSARHQGPCIIDKALGKTKDGLANLYRVYVIEPFEAPDKLYVKSWGTPGAYSYQPAFELGRLEHLRQYGVNVERNFSATA